MEFPQYRKLTGHPRFYRIEDERHFTEVYYIGTKRIDHLVEAKQYPEMLRIKDMLAADEHFEVVSADNYNDFLEK